MVSFTRAPIGGFLCGQLAGVLLPNFGWPSIFLIGGLFPLGLVVAMALWLPASPRFLAAQGNLSPHEAALLRRLDIIPGKTAVADLDLAQATRSRCCSPKATGCRLCFCG